MRSRSSSWPSPSFRDWATPHTRPVASYRLWLSWTILAKSTFFSDIRLPEGDLGGFEVAEQARRKNPNLKVLYTTGDTITDGMKVMFVAGGEMLPKPYTAPELAAAIARLLPEE